jgi:predicted AlkP superfamily phosphohydrolase/phosphomutase
LAKRRVLVIGLDGFELSLAEAFLADGVLPALATIRQRSARCLLDHGNAKRSGLAWEHFSTGLSPVDADRFSAVTFNPDTYSVWQDGTSMAPFAAQLPVRTVVFDPPYFDLIRAQAARGIVGWGAHDPGISAASNPRELWSEIEARFGPYPAGEWIYGFSWPCAEKTRVMADRLVEAVETRGRAAHWLLAERLPDWDLAMVIVSELHSGIEALWHGVDPSHPLHDLPSAKPAGAGLKTLYQAVDKLVGALVNRFDDATVVVFAAHGMGPNDADLPSMLLLPELLYRESFRLKLLCEPTSWTSTKNGLAMLTADESWSQAVAQALEGDPSLLVPRRAMSRLRRKWRALKRKVAAIATIHDGSGPTHRVDLDWMPATAYRPYWSQMPAFALPSFYDGRVRINLAGREKHGRVPLTRYEAICDQIENLIRACRDTHTGKSVVAAVERPARRDPLRLGPTEADLIIDWDSAPTGFDHPSIGRIGPVPYRRTGGHSGKYGFAYIAGQGVVPGDVGIRSTFDIVPTVIDLLGISPPPRLSGSSYLQEFVR